MQTSGLGEIGQDKEFLDNLFKNYLCRLLDIIMLQNLRDSLLLIWSLNQHWSSFTAIFSLQHPQLSKFSPNTVLVLQANSNNPWFNIPSIPRVLYNHLKYSTSSITTTTTTALLR